MVLNSIYTTVRYLNAFLSMLSKLVILYTILQEGDNVTSICDKTFNGWSHDVTVRHWACFYGRKQTQQQTIKVHQHPYHHIQVSDALTNCTSLTERKIRPH